MGAPSRPLEASGSSRARSGWLLRAGAAALGALLVAELLARLAVPVWGTPSSYDVPRNPHFRRGWVEFTAAPPAPRGSPLVVVVTHSQGYFRETTDARFAYPAQLETLLRATPGFEHAEVLNWSIDGGKALESVLLVARALEHEPDLIVYVTGPDVYLEDSFTRPPSYWVSDAWKLCYRPEIRRRASDAVLEACDREGAWGWVRSRFAVSWVRSALFERRVGAWHQWIAPPGDIAPTARSERRWRMRFSEPAFLATMSAVRRMIETAADDADSRTRLVFVAGPASRARIVPETWNVGDRMLELAGRALGEGTTIFDARAVVSSDRFYDAAHIDRDGHRELATWLEPRLRAALPAP